MVFSSAIFLFVFLPAVYILNLILPGVKAKNVALTAASLIFYAYGEPVYVLLMLVSVAFNYLAGILIAKSEKHAKLVLSIGVVLNLSMLAVFKYAGFFAELVNGVTGLSIPVPNIRLPIGISFFTFQALSYVIDVYRDRSLATKSFPNLLLYISFFPQLIAGPILKYHDVALQIENRTMTADKTARGIRRFVVGLSKKLIVANTAGFVADTIFALDKSELALPVAWIGAVAYCLQIYFDFSGYSDMAIGLGRMFGFEFAENFDYPYISCSIKEFWRRWHISLSTWFKEYLYIPLGGNRRGKIRTGINKLIVFFCTGLWHGANLTFVLWGLWHGVFIMLESYGIIPTDKIKFKPAKRLYTLLVVILGFVLFRADNIGEALTFIGAMFGAGAPVSVASSAVLAKLMSPYTVFVLAIGIVLSTPIVRKIRSNKFTVALSYASSLVLLLVCVMTLSSATYNPFIYFRF